MQSSSFIKESLNVHLCIGLAPIMKKPKGQVHTYVEQHLLNVEGFRIVCF